MIAVFGSGLDSATWQAVEAWPPGRAIGITLEDMTGPGWRIDPADPAASFMRSGGRTLRFDELTGAVLTLDAVHEQLMHTMVVEDRAYMAQEIEALLTTVLAMVHGPVVNAPYSQGYLRRRLPEQWQGEAARLGFPLASGTDISDHVQCVHRLFPYAGSMPADEAQDMTTALALATNTPFLSTSWLPGPAGPALILASTHPLLANPEHARAIERVFTPVSV